MGTSKRTDQEEDEEEKTIYALIVDILAYKDIDEIVLYYEDQQEGLGEEFLLELDLAYETILRAPHSFRNRYKNLKAVLLSRFPYHVIFRVKKDVVNALRVLHAKRNPKVWRPISRMK